MDAPDYPQETINDVIRILTDQPWEMASTGRFRDGCAYAKEVCRKPDYRAIELIENDAFRPIVNAVAMVVKQEDGSYTLARFWTDAPTPTEKGNS